MTAPATANPALASLALALAPASPAGPATPRADAAAANAAGNAPGSGFSALLLGLRAGAGVAPPAQGAAATMPAPTDATLPATDLPLPAATPAAPAIPAGGPPEAAVARPGDGAELPADGTELPPADVAALLATLEAPATATAPPAPAAQNAMAVTPPPAAPAAATAAPATPGPRARAQAASGPQAATGDATATAPAQAAPVDAPADDPSLSADATRADPLSTAAERTPEPAAGADFRARLALMLASPDRPASLEGGATAPGVLAAPASAAAATPAAATLATAGPDPLLDNLPVLEPLGDADAFSRGMGERLLLLADRGLQSATIRLQPEHLGPMEIRIRVDDDGAAQVHFTAQHAQTRDALESAIPRLRELFADQGLNLSQANVDAGRGGFAQRAFAEPPPWLRWAGGGDGAAESEPEVTAWRLSRGPERRLDVLV